MKHTPLLLACLLGMVAASAQAEATFNFSADAIGEDSSVRYEWRDAVVDGTQLNTGGLLSASAGPAFASVIGRADATTGMFKALTQVQIDGSQPRNSGSSYATLQVSDILRFSGPGDFVNATFRLSYDTVFSGVGFAPFELTDTYDHFLAASSSRSVGLSYLTPNPLYDPATPCIANGDEVVACPPGSYQFDPHEEFSGNDLSGAVSLYGFDGGAVFAQGNIDNGRYTGAVELNVTLPTAVDISLSYYAIITARCVGLVSCSLTVDSSHSDYFGINVADGGSFVSKSGYQYLGIPAPVPEPETWALMLAGLGLTGFVARRRRG